MRGSRPKRPAAGDPEPISDEERQLRRQRARGRRAREQLDRDDRWLVTPGDDDWTVQEGPTRRAVAPPSDVGSELEHLLEQRGWGDRLRGAAIHGRWAEIVGDDLAARTRPVRLAGGVLVVGASDASWAMQVRYLEGRIIQRASEVLGPELVRSIEVVVRYDAATD